MTHGLAGSGGIMPSIIGGVEQSQDRRGPPPAKLDQPRP
jgi:hypothetical protein